MRKALKDLGYLTEVGAITAAYHRHGRALARHDFQKYHMIHVMVPNRHHRPPSVCNAPIAESRVTVTVQFTLEQRIKDGEIWEVMHGFLNGKTKFWPVRVIGRVRDERIINYFD